MEAVGRGDQCDIGIDGGQGGVEVSESWCAGFVGEDPARLFLHVDPANSGETATVEGGIPVVVAHATQANA